VRMSISIDRDAAAAIREAAQEAGSTVSAFVEQVAMEAIGRRERRRRLFAHWDDADAAIVAEADRMSLGNVWDDSEPIPAAEAAQLRDQLARIVAGQLDARST
jgi:hypothetical protein